MSLAGAVGCDGVLNEGRKTSKGIRMCWWVLRAWYELYEWVVVKIKVPFLGTLNTK